MRIKYVLLAMLSLFLWYGGLHPSEVYAKPSDKEKMTLLEAIEKISQKYDVYFTFDMTLVSKVEVQYEQSLYSSAEDAISRILKGTGLKYQFYDRRFVILYKDDASGLESLRQMSKHLNGLILEGEKKMSPTAINNMLVPASLPSRSILKVLPTVAFSIEGTVTNQDGEPLAGVTVQVKGSTKATTTDAAGRFSLNDIEVNAILVFSYVGFETQEVKVGGQSNMKIIMVSTEQALGEVVVVGYGTQKKVNLTGAVGFADSKRLENRTITSVAQGLQGVIPGLNITFRSGDPADPAKFNVRGFESINGGEPLILVDGIPMDLNRVNPNDIESVSVLKDASSAAVYGARAAFGVVLITTKKGTATGRPNVNFSAQLAVNRPVYLGYEPIPRDQAGTARQILSDAYRVLNNKDLLQPEIIDASVKYQKMDNPTEKDAWYPLDGNLYYLGYIDAAGKLINNNVLQQRYDLSVSGASKNTSYYVSMGTTDKPGFYKFGNEQYNRYNVFSKVDIKITNWLSIEEKITVNTVVTDNPHMYSVYDGYRQVWAHPFFTPMEFPDLDYYLEPGDREKYKDYIGMHNAYNDIIPYRRDGGRNKIRGNDIWLTQGVTISPLKGLKIKGDFSYNSFWQHGEDRHTELSFVTGDFYAFNLLAPPYTNPGWSFPTWMNTQEFANSYYVFNALAEYNFDKLKNHDFKIMAGFNQEYGFWQNFYAKGNGIIHQNVETVSATSGTKEVGQTKNELALRGVFYRLNYAYKDKYLFEASGRYDGTSRFPKESRFGFFPSYSAGWRVSEEPFMDGTRKWLENLKIRASYGELGNQNVGSYYPYIASMGISTMPIFFDGSGNFPNRITPPSLISSSLTWETVANKNVGIDFTMLNTRLDVSFDYFIRDTKDMLMRKSYPGELGASSPQENAADLRNKGWELGINWTDRIGKNWGYRINLSLSDYETTITKYDNPTGNINDYYVGKKVGELWGYKTIGLFQTEDELASAADQTRLGTGNWALGDPHYADLNHDGVIDQGINTLDNHGDLIRIGNTTPRYAFGVNASVNFKRFAFNIFLQGIMKRDYYPGFNGNDRFYPFNTYNVEQYWIDDTWTPDNTDAYFARRRFVSGATATAVYGPQTRYLQNAGYMRIKNITLSYDVPLKFAKMKVYVNGTNLWEISKMYKLHDPEEVTGADPGYMFYRSYSFGLNFNF